MKRIDVLLTAFRDGIQSAYGARVLSADYLPAVRAASDAGIRRFEFGGGALYQASVLFCNESPYARMDAFREASGPDAELQVLSRGVSLVGLEPQGHDMVGLYARLLKRHGTDTVRNFDALNDVANIAASGQAIVAAGLSHEPAICVTDPPPGSVLAGIHTPEHYRDILKAIMEAGTSFGSICFKDSTGSMRPSGVFETVRLARKLLGPSIPIAWHTHDSLGLGIAAYLAAVEAGADRIDLSLSPLSGGACQPDLISFWHALRGSEFSLDIDAAKILAVEESLKKSLSRYRMVPEAERIDPLVLFYPMPGGAVAANANLLRDQGMAGKYDEIIHALGEVFTKGGGGSPVTPVSQYYIQQAYQNVSYGTWRRIAPGYGRMVLGYLGKTPLPPDPEVVALASRELRLPPADSDPMTLADRNPTNSLRAVSSILRQRGLPEDEESLAIAAICGEKGLRFLEGKASPSLALDPASTKVHEAGSPRAKHAAGGPTSGAVPGWAPAQTGTEAGSLSASGDFTVLLNDRAYGIKFSGEGVTVDGVSYAYSVLDGIDGDLLSRQAALSRTASGDVRAEAGEIRAPMPGMIVRINKRIGDKVAVGETVLVLESMTAEIPVNSRLSGVVVDLPAAWGDHVEAGQPLVRLTVVTHESIDAVSQAEDGTLRAGDRGDTVIVESPIAGLVLRIYKAPGERVLAGESILVAESLKMERPVNSPVEGVIESIRVKQGEMMGKNQSIAAIVRKGVRP